MKFIPALEYKIRKQLVETIKLFHQRGWSPATSTNYSFRTPEADTYTISRSGVDKFYFNEHDFLHINKAGKPTAEYEHLKPSAETLLHTMLYNQYADCEAVLHTHSLFSTVLSAQYLSEEGFFIQNLEVLKAFRGIATHEAKIWIPIFPNSQDIATLSIDIKAYLDNHPNTYGFLLAGHGLYAWGNSLAEAKRHTESFEFLFECFNMLRKG